LIVTSSHVPSALALIEGMQTMSKRGSYIGGHSIVSRGRFATFDPAEGTYRPYGSSKKRRRRKHRKGHMHPRKAKKRVRYDENELLRQKKIKEIIRRDPRARTYRVSRV
jgi:hypothetical protein